MSEKQLVVQSEHLAEEAAGWLAQRCELVRCRFDDERFSAVLGRADGLVVRTYTTVDEALLDRAPALRVVGRAGAGLNNIDVASCRRRGIEVVYTPDANTQAVVEYAITLLGDALRPRVQVRSGAEIAAWRHLRAGAVAARQLSELVLGILGLGRIGRRMAQVAQAVGFAEVRYNDITDIPPDQRFGAVPVAVETLFAESDVLTLHIDDRPSNRGFVGRPLIERMGPEAVLVNTSRGFVVDNVALASFLGTHPGALALLDVHDPEPFGADYPLLGLPNARLYPHLGASTQQADLNMSWVVRDVVAVLEGRTPRNPAPERAL